MKSKMVMGYITYQMLCQQSFDGKANIMIHRIIATALTRYLISLHRAALEFVATEACSLFEGMVAILCVAMAVAFLDVAMTLWRLRIERADLILYTKDSFVLLDGSRDYYDEDDEDDSINAWVL